MKKTKLKLKKNVWLVIVSIIIFILIIIIGINIFKNIKYRQTNEYKLLETGYTIEEIDILTSNLTEKEINSLINSKKDTFLIEILQDNYFIKNNLNRYISYHLGNENLTAREIIATVNTNTDYDYYAKDIDTDISKNYLILVNKYYHLNSDYTPDDLVNISNKYYYGENHQIRNIVYEAFINMWNQAKIDGITLIINSSYRTYEQQQAVYDDYKNIKGTTYADTIAARPGYSEHQTGLALDIFSTDNTSTSTFKDSSAYNWLKENAYKYGFIQRYQKENEKLTGFVEESWHWRYVGIEVAKYIYEHNITFDEYYAYFIANK